MITRGINPSRSIIQQLFDETLARHLWMRIEAGKFKQSRPKIGKRDKVCHGSTRFDLVPPTDNKWNVKTVVIDLTFDPRERHSVVRSRDDQGFIKQAAVFQMFQRATDVSVVPFNLDGIIG